MCAGGRILPGRVAIDGNVDRLASPVPSALDNGRRSPKKPLTLRRRSAARAEDRATSIGPS
jgi:hypothetical protein